MENCKTFYEVQIASALKKLFSLPPPPITLHKILLHLWNKNFLRDMYRNIQTCAFKVLQKLCSANLVFLTLYRNMFAEKFVK